MSGRRRVDEAGGEQAWHSVDAPYESAYPAITGGIFEFGLSDAILQMWGAFCDEIAHGEEMHQPFRCATPEEAAGAIRLVMLVNDVSLRNLIPGELAKGFGFFQAKPSSAFSPVALTPDELGAAWDGGKPALPLMSYVDGKPFGRPNAGVDMTFDFPRLIAHAARTRPLSAGTIVGSGTVSNKDADGGPGRPISEGGLGYSCIAEIRTVETIREGAPKTPFLAFGDTVRIEMKDEGGHSLFGAIEQVVEKAG